jgi:UDP-N-acetylmuramoyl-L-alanyl-D-glutamate--2,6-diaminopimelate ligase
MDIQAMPLWSMIYTMEKLLGIGRKIIPQELFQKAQPMYHWFFTFLGAFIYRFPSRKLTVIGVTGTKGKTSTTEIINAILEEAGYKTLLTNTVRFKIDKDSTDNKYKMSMPGRFFMQRTLRKGLKAGCQFAVLEITSQGAIQHRHKFIDLDALVFTNLAPEHIEAHGSYEAYRDAKLSIAKALDRSGKKRKIMISNIDDKEGNRFFETAKTAEQVPYSLKDAEPYRINKEGLDFTLGGTLVHSPLSGAFNLSNLLGAIAAVRAFGVGNDKIRLAVEKFSGIAGRMQKIDAGQDFTVIVDYAHTPDSLEKVYEVFGHAKKICVLGNAGGGRDTWKRKEMAEIAERHCDHIILTDEDPYDEDPMKIVEEMKKHINEKHSEIIMDRREAVKRALSLARTGDAVLITGKGTDPYIMRSNGLKEPWSDAEVAKDELQKRLS